MRRIFLPLTMNPQFCPSIGPHRGLHGVPTLSSGQTYQQHGVPDLISPEGYDLAWNQYQGLMIDKLNEMTQGVPPSYAPTASFRLLIA